MYEYKYTVSVCVTSVDREEVHAWLLANIKQYYWTWTIKNVIYFRHMEYNINMEYNIKFIEESDALLFALTFV